MAVKQYIGARYVPKFASPVEWAADTSYEALTIVTFNNASYTSKIQVPPTVGNPANNPQYWVLTGNYNAQVEQYRQETENYNAQVEQYKQETENYNAQVEQYRQETGNVKASLDELVANAATNKHVVTFEDYGAKGDGTTDDTQSIINAIQAANGKKLTLTSAGGTYLVNGDINLTSVKLINFGTINCNGTVTIDDSIVLLGNFYNANVVANGYGTILSKVTINHFNGVGLKIKTLTKTAGPDYNPSIFSGLLINDYDVSTGTVGVSIESPDVFLERTEVINTLTGYKILQNNVSLTDSTCWINSNIKHAENWESNIAYDVNGTCINLINCTSDSYYTAINTLPGESIRLTDFSIICNTVLFKNFTLNITNIDSNFITGNIVVHASNFTKYGIKVKNRFTNCTITSINTSGAIENAQYQGIWEASSGDASGYFDYNGLRKHIYLQVKHPNAGENLTVNVTVPNIATHNGFAVCYANNQAILLPYTLDNTTLTITGTNIPANSVVLCNIEFYERIA